MKICILANAASVHTQRWARAYAERGHQVTVLSIRPAELPGVRVETVAVGRPGAPSRLPTLLSYLALLVAGRRRLRRLGADVLHAHYTVTHGAIAAAAGFHPRVVSAWGRDVIWDDGRMPALLRLLNRFALARADAVTATSRFLAGHVERFVPPGRGVEVVPFGIDLDRFAPAAADNPAAWEGGADFRIGFVKALRPKYAPEVLVRAMPEVLAAVPEARLVLAGRGPLEPSLRALAARLGVAARVDFPGFVPHDEVPRLLAGLDVLVNCSTAASESFGVVVLEASACEVPVVVTPVGGVPEVCRDGETGLHVPPGDAAALAGALVRLARDPGLRRRLGRAGRRFVAERYRWEENVDAMLAILTRVGRRHGARRRPAEVTG